MADNKKARKSNASWRNFERSTKRVLEAIGYSVSDDCRLVGSQIDLIATKSDKLISHRLLVECKEWGKVVGVETVRGLFSIVTAATSPQYVTLGLIVAESGFTKDAKTFAESCNVKLLTLQELTLQTFDPAKIVERTVQWFEQDALAKTYVDLTCTVNEFKGGTVYKPVEKFLDEFLVATKRPGVAILGNFGSGKTSLCRHYAYLLANRWKEHKEHSLLPVYINLRELGDLCHLERDIRGTLRTEYSLECNEDELRSWLEAGRTLLILDGFDEMGARLSSAAIHSSLEALSRFVAASGTKILLTCRTHFFRTRVEEDALNTTVKLYIRDWGADELISYVSQVHGDKATKTIETIQNTYNLEELAKTPIFLRMITDTVADLGERVNRGKLYQLYTDQWIENQNYRSRVSAQEVRAFMQALALELFQSGDPTIDHRHIPTKIQTTLSLRDRESISSFDQDIRTCTFLVRDAEGHYGFVHRSFMEFFLGLKLAEEIKAKQYATFNKLELPHEVAGFLGSFYESEPDALIRLLMGDGPAMARANCARAIGTLANTPRMEDAMLLALDIEKSDLVRYRLVDSLVASKSRKGIEHILGLAHEETVFGTYCLKALDTVYSDKFLPLYNTSLAPHSPIQRVKIVLDSVANNRVEPMRDGLRAYLESNRWKEHSTVIPHLMQAIAAVADADIALACGPLLLHSSKMVPESTALTRHLNDVLTLRVRSAVELQAKENCVHGVTRANNIEKLRGKFRRFLDPDHVRRIMVDLYGPEAKISRRKLSGVKGR